MREKQRTARWDAARTRDSSEGRKTSGRTSREPSAVPMQRLRTHGVVEYRLAHTNTSPAADRLVGRWKRRFFMLLNRSERVYCDQAPHR